MNLECVQIPFLLKKNLRFFSLLFFTAGIILPAGILSAQIKFSANASYSTLSRDQALQVEFMIEGTDRLEDFTAPSFDGFNVIQGPHYGNYFSITNGDISKSVTVTYLLMPQKPGKLVINPAMAKINGKIFKSNSLTITVLNKLSGNSNPGNAMPSMPGIGRNNANEDELKDFILKKGEDPIAKIQKNLIVQLEVSKKTCYVGEPIVATYKLYTRLKSVSRVTKRPSFNGFSVSEMTTPENMDFQPDKLNGKPFYSTIIRKVQLFPLQTGEITLDPVEISSQVKFLKAGEKPRTNNAFDDLFNDFFDEDMLNGETEEHNLTQQTKPVTITVKALPEKNKPADFNGAVGKFTVQAAFNNQNIAANETGTFKLVVEGRGNLSMINAPVINWPQGIEAFEPSARENIDNASLPLSGSKTFEYPFTVNEKGNYTLPTVNFSYFNPETEAYETATTNIVRFAVTKVADKEKIIVKDPVVKKESLLDKATDFFNNLLEGNWWWPALVLLLVIWGAYQWQQNRKVTHAKNELKKIIEKEKQAAQAAEIIPITDGVISTFNNDPLEKARQELKKENAPAFYNELHTALWNFMQQKYQLSPTDMSKKVVADKLRSDLFDDSLVNSFQQILDTCELALYTPVHSQAEMYQLMHQAETFIKTVEYKIV